MSEHARPLDALESESGRADLDEIEQRLEGFFRDQVSLAIPSRETDLFARGLVDSLLFVELLVALEEDFGCSIDMDRLEIEELSSVRLIAAWVVRQRSAATADGTGGPIPPQ